MPDLTERLASAAVAAIKAREATITEGSRGLRGLHIEPEVNGAEIVTRKGG